MKSEDKNKFDALATMRQDAWRSFDHRRAYEWKVSIPLWTAFAAFIGLVVTGRVHQSDGVFGAVLGVSVSISTLYALWIRSVQEVNDIDKKIAFDIDKEMRELAGVSLADGIKKKIKEFSEGGRRPRDRPYPSL